MSRTIFQHRKKNLTGGCERLPLRPIFDVTVPPAVPDIEAMRQRGHARDKRSPMPVGPRTARKVLIASTGEEMAMRLQQSMIQYGWDAHQYVNMEDFVYTYQYIADSCRRQGTEILILDDSPLIYAGMGDQLRTDRKSILEKLKRDLPGIKIVGFQTDPWLNQFVMVPAASVLDLVWVGTSPQDAVWQHPDLSCKVFNMHFPQACCVEPSDQPVHLPALFRGTMASFNYHRRLWAHATTQMNLPIRWQKAEQSGGRDLRESYMDYLKDLADSTCVVNFSMRSNQSRIVTGRCFETLLSGSLLLQEFSSNMDYYWVAGEHYLEFTTIGELRDLLTWVVEHPAEAEAIRQRGHAFAREVYRDEKIIGYLEYRLYHQELTASD